MPYDIPPAYHAPAPAHLVSHNGSLMQVTSQGNGAITISYVDPKPELWPVGVRPGTILLRGTWDFKQRTIEATAVVFTFACGAVPYGVGGTINSAGVLTLVGAAPVIDPWHCITVGWTWASANASLVFIPWRQP